MHSPNERNKAVIAAFPALLRSIDLAAIQSLFTEDFRLHDSRHPDWPQGHAGAVRMFLRLNSMAPDISATIEDIFGEDDKVCVRWRFKGTLTGAFESQTGDGTRFESITFSIYRFRDGRVAEDWGADALLPTGHPWRSD